MLDFRCAEVRAADGGEVAIAWAFAILGAAARFVMMFIAGGMRTGVGFLSTLVGDLLRADAGITIQQIAFMAVAVAVVGGTVGTAVNGFLSGFARFGA